MANFGGVVVPESLFTPMVSLSGYKGTKREAEHAIDSLIGATDAMTVPACPQRMALLIEWSPIAVGNLYVSFVERGANQNFILTPGSTLQIDQNLPWTGSVELSTRDAAAVGFVEILEIRLK